MKSVFAYSLHLHTLDETYRAGLVSIECQFLHWNSGPLEFGSQLIETRYDSPTTVIIIVILVQISPTPPKKYTKSNNQNNKSKNPKKNPNCNVIIFLILFTTLANSFYTEFIFFHLFIAAFAETLIALQLVKYILIHIALVIWALVVGAIYEFLCLLAVTYFADVVGHWLADYCTLFVCSSQQNQQKSDNKNLDIFLYHHLIYNSK